VDSSVVAAGTNSFSWSISFSGWWWTSINLSLGTIHYPEMFVGACAGSLVRSIAKKLIATLMTN
jgi:hypothetical protein